MPFTLLYVTHASQEAAQLVCDQLLNKKLIACANIFPIQSSYWWQSAIETDDEWVSLLKTTNEAWPIIEKAIEAIHPYDVPCIMRIQVEANEAYENWIRESVELP